MQTNIEVEYQKISENVAKLKAEASVLESSIKSEAEKLGLKFDNYENLLEQIKEMSENLKGEIETLEEEARKLLFQIKALES